MISICYSLAIRRRTYIDFTSRQLNPLSVLKHEGYREVRTFFVASTIRRYGILGKSGECNSCIKIYTVSQKTSTQTFVRIFTRPNFFTATIIGKFAMKRLLKIPPHLKRVNTIPREIMVFQRLNLTNSTPKHIHALLVIIIIM